MAGLTIELLGLFILCSFEKDTALMLNSIADNVSF